MTLVSPSGGVNNDAQGGIGMAVTGAGVTSNTIITALLGSNQYTVNNSQSVTAALTVALADPIGSATCRGKRGTAGLQFINCTNPPATVTFNKLPGQSGCLAAITPNALNRFTIIDADSNYLTFGHAAAEAAAIPRRFGMISARPPGDMANVGAERCSLDCCIRSCGGSAGI